MSLIERIEFILNINRHCKFHKGCKHYFSDASPCNRDKGMWGSKFCGTYKKKSLKLT